MKNKIKYFLASLPTAAIAAPFLALAQDQVPVVNAFVGPESLRNFFCSTVFGWAFTILMILAAFFALVAAYKYLTAGGDPEKIKGASNTLIYAAIAVVVGLLAKGLPLFIGNLFGVGITGCR